MTARKKAVPAVEAASEIVAIKGFHANLQCRGFQYEIGKAYEHAGNVEICKSGFHAIDGHPLAVFDYYPPAGSRFAEVRVSGGDFAEIG